MFICFNSCSFVCSIALWYTSICLGEKLFEPRVLFDIVVNETYRLFPLDFYRGFPFLPVVEPCLRPPADSGTVGIDGDDSRYVEALDVDVQFRQQINESAARYGFVMKFFLPRRLLRKGTHHAAGQGSSGNPLSAGSVPCRPAAWLCAPVPAGCTCSASSHRNTPSQLPL